MADIMLGQLLHRPTIDPISESSPLSVQLSGRKAALVSNVTESSTTVAAGGSEQTTILAPAGTMVSLTGMSFSVARPTGATSGTHSVRVYQYAYTVLMELASTAAEYNADLQMPLSTVLAAIKGVTIDAATGIIVVYSNNTDASQTNKRMIRHNGLREIATW
jgi:hypothetical protein